MAGKKRKPRILRYNGQRQEKKRKQNEVIHGSPREQDVEGRSHLWKEMLRMTRVSSKVKPTQVAGS